jgi:signal transduction histidine kinase
MEHLRVKLERKTEVRLASAMEGLRAGIALFDEYDRLVVANPAYRQIHRIIEDILLPGVSFETILRENVRRSRFDLGADEAEAYIARRMEQHNNPGPTIERRLNDGRWEQVREQRLNDGGILLVILDMTREKQREQALTEAKLAAESASRAKTQFLANMSHELRTPLNAIIGFSDLMLSGMFGPIGSAKYREYAGDIHRSGHHLLDVINGVLDLAKIEAGRLEIAPEDVILAPLVDDCVGTLRVSADQRSVTLAGAVAADLPAVRADRRMLKQIMLNLLSNAVKFTPAGGNVTVGAALTADGKVTVSVTDTGIGIAPKDLARIFEPFQQAEATTARPHEGTGLGLAITKNLVELNGGVLTIESEVGVGTTVAVRLAARADTERPTWKRALAEQIAAQ